jgi:hypothetical protein
VGRFWLQVRPGLGSETSRLGPRGGMLTPAAAATIAFIVWPTWVMFSMSWLRNRRASLPA